MISRRRILSPPVDVSVLTGMISLWLVIVCLLFTSGCSGSKTVRVRGKVTVANKPAEGARVRFYPTEEMDISHIPEGRVDQNGSFVLSTFEPGDGVPPGAYKVVITWRETRRTLGEEREGGPDKLNGKYADPKTTPLRATISSSSPDAIFNLPQP